MSASPQNDSPITRHFHQRNGTVSSNQAHGSMGTYSTRNATEAVSPQGSVTNDTPDSPVGTTFNSSSPPSSPSIDPSMVAVHGSAAGTPMLKNRRNLESSYFTLPKPKGVSTTHDKQDWGEHEPAGDKRGDLNKINGKPEDTSPGRITLNPRGNADPLQAYTSYSLAQKSGSHFDTANDHAGSKRTVNTGRVIAIDYESACVQDVLTQSLKQLRELGHPIHLITARPQSDQDVIVKQLTEQGITVGMGDDDIVAVVWFTDICDDAYDGNCQGDGDVKCCKDGCNAGHLQGKEALVKLKILRAINASLFIADSQANIMPILQADPAIQCLLLGHDQKQDTAEKTQLEDSTLIEVKPVDVQPNKNDATMRWNVGRAEKWEDAIMWVRYWDAQISVGFMNGPNVGKLERSDTCVF